MDHQRLKSSNLYSLAHDGTSMEVRFNCQACKGTGEGISYGLLGEQTRVKCPTCKGTGHTGTYRGNIPAAVHNAILKAKSPGSEFSRLVRRNPAYRLEKAE